MQIILVSRHLKSARTLTIMPRHVAAGVAIAILAILLAAVAVSWAALQLRMPAVERWVLSVADAEGAREAARRDSNLQLLSARLGELKAQVLQLDMLGERVAGLAGLRRDAGRTPAAGSGRPAEGGPFLPSPVAISTLEKEIEQLSRAVAWQAGDFADAEVQLLSSKVSARRLPSLLPVAGVRPGSGFGERDDPILGLRSRHEGIDFNAPAGTPVRAAADGVVASVGPHPEFGTMIDIEHGEGLVSRYAHLSQTQVVPGVIVRRGERIGAVGTTGRSTGPHLHFEVRRHGVAQNPLPFLQRDPALAALLRR